jgi:hypothetical protein
MLLNSSNTFSKFDKPRELGKVQVRYALRGKYQGRNLTKFVGESDWNSMSAPVE